MKKNSIKKHWGSVFITIIISIWLISATLEYMLNLTKFQSSEINNDISVISQANAEEIRFTFDRYIKTLSAVVKLIEQSDNKFSTEIISALNTIEKQDDFATLSIESSVDGTSYFSNGEKSIINEFNYADKIKTGTPFILNSVNSAENAEQTVSILVPIKENDGSYKYALRGYIPTMHLTNIFVKTFVQLDGYYHIIDGEGNYISTGNSANALLMNEKFFDAIDKLTYEKGFSATQIKNDLENKTKGYALYSYNGEKRYTFYAPVGINDWMILMVVPKAAVDKMVLVYSKNTFKFVGKTIVALLVVLFCIFYYQKKQRVNAQLNEKSLKILAEQTNKAIFEWNFDSHGAKYLTGFKKHFRSNIIYTTYDQAINSQTVYKDDIDKLDLIRDSIKSAKNLSNIKLRIMDDNQVYNWCEISIVIIKKQNGAPFKALGFIENINEQIKKEEQLRIKSEIDQLTDVYNKATTEYLISDIIKNSINTEKQHALLIIDVDNYKDVNDRFGHLYGDIVLAQLAASLKLLCNGHNIIGRLGGDEFFVLIENITDINDVKNKLSQICEKFQKTYTKGEISANISASIGISLFPEHGQNFEELYKAADIALYNVKANGKNNFEIYYDGADVRNYVSSRTNIDELGKVQKNFYSNKLEYLFNLMYNSEDTTLTATMILQLIAQEFGFSRANIFHFDESNNSAKCMYEWCEEDVSSIKNMQPDLTYDECYFIVDEFAKSGGMFVKKISEFPEHTHAVYKSMGIKSLIYFSIIDQGKCIGDIVFQDCKNDNITLTQSDLNEVKIICEMLSTFLVKQRSIDREREYYQKIETIMNNIDGFAYVINPKNYKVLFENQKVKHETGLSSIGGYCYESFMGLNEPCEVCPARYLLGKNKKHCVEIYNEKYGICSRTTAAEIDWTDSKKAWLINSIDITEYKI